jgi:hypothetical protein
MSFPVEISETTSLFHGAEIPVISFEEYVERLVYCGNLWCREQPNFNSQGICCAIIAVEYLERANIRASPKSIHRLFLAAFLVAIKYLDDFGMSNTFWGKAGGCTLDEINKMEIAFGNLLDWNFFVSTEMFETKKRAYST